jgi:hypothetical protein
MPRSKLPKLDSKTFGSFEPRRKNPVLLAEDSVLDNHQKSIRIGEKASILSLSNDELRIEGDLSLDGKLNSHVIRTDNAYLDFVAGDFIRFFLNDTTAGNEYKMYESAGSFLHVAQGDSINWDSGAGEFNFTDNGGVSFKIDGANRTLFLYDDDNTADYLSLAVAANGASTIATNDNDGTSGNLTLDPDGDLIISGADVKIDATKNLYLDGGGDTYIYEATADIVRHVVGGDILLELSEYGADGNTTNFKNTCVGFTQLEPTYDATSTAVDFRHSNKQNLTFGSGNITNMDLYFPLVSGNFVLLLKQDGTGSRTITNWKAREFDETAADGSAAVVWAGGSAPTLTTDANHVDILSFYWDADNEIAYGVATLDFQF